MENNICKIEDISEKNSPSIYVEDGLKPFIQFVKDDVLNQVADLSTLKGRKEIASLASKVSRSKKSVENSGREYLKKLKAQPKIVEKELREFILEMDALRDEVRKPLSDWECEQARIEAEEIAKAEAEKMAALLESDHEIGLLLNENYTREAEEALAEKERQRLAYEQKLKDEAAAKAEQEKIEAVEREKAAQAREEAANKEAAAIAAKAEQDRITAKKALIEAQKKAAQDAINAKEKAERDAKEAAEKAVSDEIKRREAEEEVKKQEQEALEKNRAHVGKVRKEVKEWLMSFGVQEDIAKKIVLAASKKQISSISVNY